MLRSTFVLFFFILSIFEVSSQNQIGSDIDGESAYDMSGYSISMPDSKNIAIGAPNAKSGNTSSTNSGHVRVFTFTGGSWLQKGNDIDGLFTADEFGHAVSMPDSNTLGIGSYKHDGNGSESGQVQIYKWNGANWVQKGNDINGEMAGDWSGYSISMPDSNTIAIGAPENRGTAIDAGHVRIYRWRNNQWQIKGTDIDGEAQGDWSGNAVSMPDSNTIAIGAMANDGQGLNNAGHVRIYSWDGQNWVQKGSDINGTGVADASGYSITMPNNNTVAIGAPAHQSNKGEVKVFHWNGSNWNLKGNSLTGTSIGDFFGHSIAMSNENNIVVGAPKGIGWFPSSGYIKSFSWNGTSWGPNPITISAEQTRDGFASALAFPDSNTLAIGAFRNNGSSPVSGHVRVFDLNPITTFTTNRSQKTTFQVFPNPANQLINIESSVIEKAVLRLYNINGDLVESLPFRHPSFKLNIEKLSSGVYFLELNGVRKKLIVTE